MVKCRTPSVLIMRVPVSMREWERRTIARWRGFGLQGAGGAQRSCGPVAPNAAPRQRGRAALELAAFEVVEPVLVDRNRGGAPRGRNAVLQRALRKRANEV